MPDSHDDFTPNAKAVDVAVSWVRFLLPFAIGAVGLYVGLIIAPMETRIKSLEDDVEVCTTHVIKDSQIMKEFQRRVETVEASMEYHKTYDHQTYCLKEDFKELRLEVNDLSKSLARHKEFQYYNNGMSPSKGGH